MSKLQTYTKSVNLHKLSKQQHKQPSAKTSLLIANQKIHQDKARTTQSQFDHNRSYYSQPKVENKKMRFYRATHSSFFNHLHSTKSVQAEQIMDDQFTKYLDNVQKTRGFKGAKTHSWNQLVYLTPQKRLKKSNQQLEQVKQELYKIIKTQECKDQERIFDKYPVKSTLVQFLTGYNPSSQGGFKQQHRSQSFFARKSNRNVIRQKLKKHKLKTQYKQKMKNYEMLFNGYKF